MLLHIGGANTATVITTVVVIFFLIFAISFAFGKIPEGERHLSREWAAAWFKASLPRLVIAGVFSGLLLAGALLGGDNKTKTATAASCNQSVPPLTGQALTDARLLGAIDGTQRMAGAARGGDIAGVQAIFYGGDAHNVMHDIDAPLRRADGKLAKDLCLAVVVVENQMATALDAEVIARESDQIAAFLQQAREVLSQLPTGSPVVSGAPGGLCEQPVGAVTSLPLTAERLTNAATALREMAEAIDDGRDVEAVTIFFERDGHNLTHDIDGPLREVDEQLAIKLCQEIVSIEVQLVPGVPAIGAAFEVRDDARLAADDIEAAGRTLGIIQ